MRGTKRLPKQPLAALPVEEPDDPTAGLTSPRSTQLRPAGCSRRLPVLTWLPQYTKALAWADLNAGLVVGVVIIPQARF